MDDDNQDLSYYSEEEPEADWKDQPHDEAFSTHHPDESKHLYNLSPKASS